MRAKIRLVEPEPGRTSSWYIRGTYLGHYVERSARTGVKAAAQKILKRIKREIERGEFGQAASGPTFSAAALAYMKDDGERQFMTPLLLALGDTPLAAIDQALIDATAERLCATAPPATRNRKVYTPISAVLRHAGVATPIKRPRGAQGRPRRHWMRPEHVDAFLAAAWRRHPRFAALCTLLLYCGCRLSEALAIRVEDVHLDVGLIDLPVTKNGEPQRLHLPPIVIEAIELALLEPGNATWNRPTSPRSAGSLFCLTKSGALYKLFREVEALSGVTLPRGVAFHLARHTYGAWMRATGTRLEDTGRWTSAGGARPYDHYEITEAAKAANLFPGAAGRKSG